MHEIVASVRDRLTGLCATDRVLALHVVGSAASGGFDPDHSDIDFTVRFEPGPRGGFFDVDFALLHDLRERFGRHLDLIEARRVQNRTGTVARAALKELSG